jgi:ribonuclease HIII
VAAKSITIDRAAADVLRMLGDHASKSGRAMTASALQNGTRIRISDGAAEIALNVYPSKGGGCKVVFDRPDSAAADEIAALLGGAPSVTRGAVAASAGIAPVRTDAAAWVGSDESGKGDYFGPLVVAAVATDAQQWRVLETLGVQDSKTLSDARIAALAGDIRQACVHEVVVIMPPRYNQLWAKFGNVNRLLAWAHARAIENVLERTPNASVAIADQFGDKRLIESALFKRGRSIELLQMPRAERDPAVAAASLLARAEFVRRLDQLGRSVGVRLPKGASAAVDAAARALVAQRGAGVLDEIAKRHFKTTERVLG